MYKCACRANAHTVWLYEGMAATRETTIDSDKMKQIIGGMGGEIVCINLRKHRFTFFKNYNIDF